jgi:TfoX/Sxy family transcriptional regulator of competence genes
MFGGWCLYCNGAVFALIADGAVYLKGDNHNIPDFEARNLQTLQTLPRQTRRHEILPGPARNLRRCRRLKRWATGAINATLRKSKRK